MELLSVRVPEFGPLRSVELEMAPGLNVVYGHNEAGKTTLLDFLLSHLFRWERRTGTRLETVLGDVDRFGEVGAAGGGVALRLAGEVHDYPGGGPSLLHHLGLEHAGLAGLFCVRSGELDLPGSAEFWAELKKVLSGLPEGVETLRAKAHEEAGLTATGRLSDRSDETGPGLQTRYDELRERVRTLERLQGRLEEASRLSRRIAELERRRERLELARRARIAELHARLLDARETEEELPDVERPKIEAWRERAEEEARLERQADRCRERISGLKTERDDADEEKAAALARVEALEGRLAEVEGRDLEERAREARETEAPADGRLTPLAEHGGTVVFLAGVAAAFFTPSDLLAAPRVVLAIVAVLLTGGAAYLWGKRRRVRAEEAEERRRAVLEDASAAGLEVEAAGEVPAAVHRLERRLAEAREERGRAEERARNRRERLEEEEEELARLEERIEAAGEALSGLREALEFEDFAAATAALERREDAATRRKDLEGRLRELAGGDEERWSVEPPEVDGAVPKWDPDEEHGVQERLDEARAEYARLREEFTRAHLSAPEDVLPELAECRAQVREIELNRDAGLLAGAIFATMDEALEERLSRALARDGDLSVAGLLRRITDRYVELDRDEGNGLTARDAEGRSFRLGQLSRGTRDQVHLALRLGLAGSALDAAGVEEPGFFLLDDAFLTADWERRERLVEAARELADRGWQIVYLTCDDHLRDLFVDAGARLHEL